MSRRVSCVLQTLGALLGLVGAVAPWVPHEAAGLNVGGFDLFEMSKLLPAVRSGSLPLLREAFLLPLLTSALVLALVPACSRSTLLSVRWLCPALAVAVTLAALPGYPAILTAYRNAEVRGQFLLATGACLLAMASPLARRFPHRVPDGLAIALALGGLGPGLAALLRVRPLFSKLYAAPVGVGWGIAACIAGCAAVLASAIPRKR